MLAHPDVHGARNVLLATADAVGLYERLGFRPLDQPERYLNRRGSGPEPFGAAAPG